MNWALIQNSLVVAASSTALALLIGLAVALCMAASPRRIRVVLLIATVMAFALPPFLVTSTWIYFLGHTGVWRAWLPFDIYSLGGTIFVLALLHWPISALLASAKLNRIEQHQLEIEPQLRGVMLLRVLLIPSARAALFHAAVITFVLTLNNFAVPAILQTNVFPAEVWLRFSTKFDTAGALLVSWPLIVAPLLLVMVLRKQEVAWPHAQTSSPPHVLRRQLGRGVFGIVSGATALVVVLSVLIPLSQLLISQRTWAEFGSAFAAGRSAMWSSAWLSAVAAGLCVCIGVLLAKPGISSWLWLTFLVPGVLLGIALINIFNRPVLVAVYQSAGIVIVAWVLRYVALGAAGALLAKRAVDRTLVDWARLHGASRWRVFRLAQWRQIAPVLAAVGFVVYLLCLWDAETILLIVPPGGETLALRIFNLLHYGHNAQVNALCLLLLALALAPIGLAMAVKALTKRRLIFMCAAAMAFGAGCSDRPADGSSVESKLFSAVKVIGTRGTAPGQFNKPRSVAVDAADNLYVVDMTGRVQKFSPDGEYLLSWQMPETTKGRPKGMCPDTDGHMVVIEPHYSRVNHFSADGKLAAQWGNEGTNAGQIRFPRAAVVNARGDIFVSEYGVTERVQKFTAHGAKFLLNIGRPGSGPGELNRAEGLGMDSNGLLYVADSCNHRIQVFTDDGKFVRAHGHAGTGVGEFSYPYDVRVDAAGNQFVCEFGNSRIQVFDSKDVPVEAIGGVGSRPGRFNNPWALALDSLGNLYVADGGNHRVQKFIRKEALNPANSVLRRQSHAAASSSRPCSVRVPYPSPGHSPQGENSRKNSPIEHLNRSAAVSQTSRSGWERAATGFQHSRAPVQGFNARWLDGHSVAFEPGERLFASIASPPRQTQFATR